MAVRFMEGFGAYANGEHLDTTAGSDPYLLWDEWGNVPGAPLGEHPGPVVYSWHSDVNGVRKYAMMDSTDNGQFSAGVSLSRYLPSGATSNRMIIGMRLYRTTTYNNLLWQCRADGRVLGFLGIRSDGYLIWLPESVPDLERTPNALESSDPVPVNEWVYLEVDVSFDYTGGNCYFWINDKASGSHTSTRTSAISNPAYSQNCNYVRTGEKWSWGSWQNGNRVTDIYYDFATRRGPIQIWYQPADAAGSSAGFTPSAGSNYQNVDDIGPDDDTTYNSSTTSTTKDQIGHSQAIEGAPIAVQPVAFAKYTGLGAAELEVGLLSGATESLADPLALSADYSGIAGSIYENDPNTAAAWTAANSDAAETVYKHT